MKIYSQYDSFKQRKAMGGLSPDSPMDPLSFYVGSV